MKYTTISLLCFTSLILCIQSCDLFDKADKKDELPPATQEGKNTFGCLVNGEVWLPKGNAGPSSSNLDLSYDPSFNDGTFDLRCYRYLDSQNIQYIILFSDSLSNVGIYPLMEETNQIVSFDDGKCYYSINDTDIRSEGSLVITKFDLQNLIISGTFEFTLYKADCDTVKITQGRFDMKI